MADTPWWFERRHHGFKVSRTELAVDRCMCGKKLGDKVVDSPIRDVGTWAYMGSCCWETQGLKDIGTIHRNIPA